MHRECALVDQQEDQTNSKNSKYDRHQHQQRHKPPRQIPGAAAFHFPSAPPRPVLGEGLNGNDYSAVCRLPPRINACIRSRLREGKNATSRALPHPTECTGLRRRVTRSMPKKTASAIIEQL